MTKWKWSPPVVLLVLVGIAWIIAASNGWHLSCHPLDVECTRVLGLNFGKSITVNPRPSPSSGTGNAIATSATPDTTTSNTSTGTNGIPIARPGNPIKVDCPINSSTGAVENDQSPTVCFWITGPGTGAEDYPPPNPQAGATYDVDVGETCTWQDAGKDDTGTGEDFVCPESPSQTQSTTTPLP